jgi:hypothetical protein
LARALDGSLVVGLFFALVVALELGVEMLAAEDIEQRVAAPSPFLARSFMRVTRRQRFW